MDKTMIKELQEEVQKLNLTSYDLNERKTVKDLDIATKEKIIEIFLKIYKLFSVSKYILLGLKDNENLYTKKLKENEILTKENIQLTTESSGGLKLKFSISKATQQQLINTATKRMTLEKFNKIVANNQYNQGENYEMIETTYRRIKWEKDSIRFDKQGDISLKTQELQVKMFNASLSSLKTILKAMNENI